MTEEAEGTFPPAELEKGDAVLCVDDDPRVLSALARVLSQEPYDVLRAEGAREALDLMDRFPVKVVVTDERMPLISGSELLTEVRQRWPWVGRIILTGYPGGPQAGADIRLSKPWDEEALKHAIRRLMADVASDPGLEGEGPPESWRDLGGEAG